MQNSNRLIFSIVVFCFFISGLAGLVYQLVWMRYLALFLGHTSYAIVAVLVAFMGGLAIGNAVFGAWVDKAVKPLALYAWLEFGIAVYALLFPFYYTACHDAYTALARSWQPTGASALFLKLAFSFAAILLPTILMGATLPVLTRFITRSLAELREKVAALYAVNSAGAVAGCIVADFWWVPEFGLEFSLYAAAALNFLAGLVAFALSARTGERAATAREQAPSASAPSEEFTPRELRWAILGIGVSGFVAMLYEVAWTRLLALALGSSTHAFSLMLITFIAGIAAGAWIVYRWKSLRRSLEAFAWAEIALAVTVFVSMFFYESLPFWFLKLASLLTRQSSTFPVYQLLQATICFAVMFIPAVCLGLTLPLVSRIATVELSRTGRSVGKVFAINTLGTVLGAMATGLWLMPALGLARTFAVGVALNALIGLAILARHPLNWRRGLAASLGTAVFVWVAGEWFTYDWRTSFSLGLWRNEDASLTRAGFNQLGRMQTLKFARDGAGSTVTVTSWREGPMEQLALRVNGKVDASTMGDVATQLLIGHIPVLLRPAASEVLVVGLGSGMTAAAVAKHPSVQHVDVVEISPDVIEAARVFEVHNDRVHENPRVRIVVDDAKAFLQTTPRRYDVLISEPSNPWMAGVAGVFSQEYYALCRQRLQPGGLMVQWVQVYETNDETLALVLRTFGSVFPFFSVWQPGATDLVLIGTTEPFEPDLAALLKGAAEPAVKADLERIEIDRPVALLARELISWQNGGVMVSPEGPIHSDFFPELEYRAQEAFFTRQASTLWLRFDETLRIRPSTMLGAYLREHPLTEADCKTIARYYLAYGVPSVPVMASLLHRWRRDFPSASLPLEISAKISDRATLSEVEAQRYRPMREQLLEQARNDPVPLRLFADYILRTYRTQRSVYFAPPTEELELVMKRLAETDTANRRVYQLYLAEFAWDRGNDDECLRLGLAAIGRNSGSLPHEFRIDPTAPISVLARMLETLWRARRTDEAKELAQYVVSTGYAAQDVVLASICRKVLEGVAR